MWSACSSSYKRKKRVKAAKIDKRNKEEETSAVSISIRLMQEETKKLISRRMIKEKRKRKRN